MNPTTFKGKYVENDTGSYQFFLITEVPGKNVSGEILYASIFNSSGTIW
jgi:hypothetical protein